MLHVNGLTYRLGARTLFDNTSVALPPNAKVGFVGRNGTGKTTLFRILMDELGPDGGSVTVPKGARIGRVAQEAPGGPETLLEVVLAADTERAALLAEAETATDPGRIADIQTRLVDKDAHSAPARAAAILAGLGFDHAAQNRACSEFSGGWRMRVALAALLFTEPDLLLLDEPTNYLDLEGTLWLQTYLSDYPHSTVVISHDRDLLNASVDFILHLSDAKLELYRGTYDTFERMRRERQAQNQKMRRRQEEERARIQSFVDRFKAKASKATQAQSRIKMLAKMEPISALVDSAVPPFDFPTPQKLLAPPLITLDGASVGYGERPVLRGLNLVMDVDDRIGLLGSNGNGKSTFAKLIGGRLSAMSGHMRRSPAMRVAYFAQHQMDELDPGATAVAHVARLMPDAKESAIRARAASMGFTALKADTPVAQLSGGEKARLLMGLATAGGAHLLILDEPTNHLDIDSRDALVQAINEYTGAVVLISHDRYLLEACVDRLWLVNGGTVKPYAGDMDDYRRLVLGGPGAKDAVKERRPEPAETTRAPAPKPQAKPSPSTLRERIRGIETAMEKLTALIADLDAKLAQPGLFKAAPNKAHEMTRARATAAERLQLAEEAWLAAQAESEMATG